MRDKLFTRSQLNTVRLFHNVLPSEVLQQNPSLPRDQGFSVSTLPAKANRRFVFFEAHNLLHVEHLALEAVHYHLSQLPPSYRHWSDAQDLTIQSRFLRKKKSCRLVCTRPTVLVHLRACCHRSAHATASTLLILRKGMMHCKIERTTHCKIERTNVSITHRITQSSCSTVCVCEGWECDLHELMTCANKELKTLC